MNRTHLRSARPGAVAAALLLVLLTQGAAAQSEPDSARTGFIPDEWGVGGAVTWKDKVDLDEIDAQIDFHADWERDRTEALLTLRTTFERKGRETTRNEQLGRLRWFQTVKRALFVMIAGSVERDQTTLYELPLDYVLLHGRIGPGIRRSVDHRYSAKIAVTRSEFYVRLLEYDLSERAGAWSAYLDHTARLTSRVSIRHWMDVYFFAGSRDWGVESEAELSYAVTRTFLLGLRHIYQDNVATADAERRHEMRLFTKLNF